MKRKNILEMVCSSVKIKNYKGGECKVIIISLLCCFLLCSCQSPTQITMKVDLSSDIYSTGELSVHKGDYQDALNRCQQFLDTVPADSLAAADAYKIMGGIYASYLEDKDTAINYINKAIQIDEREKNEIGLARDYNAMSKVYTSLGGDTKEGFQYIEKAEQIYEKYGMSDTSENAGTLVNKGRLYNMEGEYEKAIDYMLKAQEIYKQEPGGEDVPLYIEIGQIYLEMKEYEKALEVYQKAQKICEAVNSKYYLAKVQNQIAWLYGEQEDYETGIKYYEQALEYFKNNIDYETEALIYNNIAYMAEELGWEADKVISMAIDASRTIEKIDPETIPSKSSKKSYKGNLKYYYRKWSNDTSEEGFEKWYQQVVLNGMDWKGLDIESGNSED